jgi:hypothetical protein
MEACTNKTKSFIKNLAWTCFIQQTNVLLELLQPVGVIGWCLIPWIATTKVSD